MLYSNCATCTLAQRCIATVLTSFSYVADVQRRDAICSSHGHNNKHTWLHNDIATLRSIYIVVALMCHVVMVVAREHGLKCCVCVLSLCCDVVRVLFSCSLCYGFGSCVVFLMKRCW